MSPSRHTLTTVLWVVRCFNAAAFIALAFFYFAAYCLPPLPSVQFELTPLAQSVHPARQPELVLDAR